MQTSDTATNGHTLSNSNVLAEALQAGFVFNVNMLMQQMVASQHALQQVLTAATARSVADITSHSASDTATFKQSVDIVLKAIEESALLHIKMMQQLTEEAVKCAKVLNKQ